MDVGISAGVPDELTTGGTTAGVVPAAGALVVDAGGCPPVGGVVGTTTTGVVLAAGTVLDVTAGGSTPLATEDCAAEEEGATEEAIALVRELKTAGTELLVAAVVDEFENNTDEVPTTWLAATWKEATMARDTRIFIFVRVCARRRQCQIRNYGENE